MHYAIVEAHQSKQALCTMHFALLKSWTSSTPSPGAALVGATSLDQVGTGLHILHFALLVLKVECIAQDAQEMGTSLHILQACIMYVKGRRNGTLYFYFYFYYPTIALVNCSLH